MSPFAFIAEVRGFFDGVIALAGAIVERYAADYRAAVEHSLRRPNWPAAR